MLKSNNMESIEYSCRATDLCVSLRFRSGMIELVQPGDRISIAKTTTPALHLDGCVSSQAGEKGGQGGSACVCVQM